MMIDPNTETILGYGGGATAALLAINYFIRLFSRNRVEGKKDSAEIDLITRLEKENHLLRENANLAYRERNEAYEQLAELRTEMALLKRDLADSESRLRILNARLDELDRRRDI